MRSVSSATWTRVLPGVLLVLAELGDDLGLAFLGQRVMRRRRVAGSAARSPAPRRRRGPSARPARRRRRSAARRAGARGTRARSGCAVEVAVEVEQVGLDQLAAAGLERRAHADVVAAATGRRRPSRAARVDAVAGRHVAVGRARGSRSGSRARGRACRRARPRRVDRERRAEQRRRRTRRAPPSTSPRMWLEETISPSTSQQRHDARLEALVGLQQRRRRPARRWPKRKFSPTRHVRRAERARRARRRRTPARVRAANAASNGITTSSCDAERRDELGLALERRQQLRRARRGDDRRAGAGRT